jgi:hypothetical protein
MSPEPPHISTRPSNANRHPGHEQHHKYTIKRRSTAVVAAEKAAKKAANEQKVAQIKAGLKDVAEIEKQKQQKQKYQMQNTGVIASSNTAIPRKKHKRPSAAPPEIVIDNGGYLQTSSPSSCC